MAVAARIAEFEAMTTTDPLGAVGHSATSLADAGAVGAAGVATGAATGAAVVAVVAPEPPVAPLEKDQGQPPARDQGQPPARDQGQPPAKAPSTARAQKPEFYAMSETASCPPPAPPATSCSAAAACWAACLGLLGWAAFCSFLFGSHRRQHPIRRMRLWWPRVRGLQPGLSVRARAGVWRRRQRPNAGGHCVKRRSQDQERVRRRQRQRTSRRCWSPHTKHNGSPPRGAL